MAKEGTFIGEVQRAWSRFWGLSWKWKGPVLGVLALIIIAAVSGGGSDDAPQQASPDATETPTTSKTDEPAAVKSTATPSSSNTPKPTKTPKPTETPKPTATPDTRSEAFAEWWKRNWCEPGRATSWCSFPRTFEIVDDIVVARTDLVPDAEGREFAGRICNGLSAYVFSTSNAMGLTGLRVLSKDGQQLVQRTKISDLCFP